MQTAKSHIRVIESTLVVSWLVMIGHSNPVLVISKTYLQKLNPRVLSRESVAEALVSVVSGLSAVSGSCSLNAEAEDG